MKGEKVDNKRVYEVVRVRDFSGVERSLEQLVSFVKNRVLKVIFTEGMREYIYMSK